MKNEAIKILQRKKNAILERWLQLQANEEGLREDLMTNEDLRVQCEELLSSFIDNLTDSNFDKPEAGAFANATEVLSSLSISRAKQGFSPRETGAYIFSLKDAILATLREEIQDTETLYKQSLAVTKIMDNFSITTFETFIKGREEVILRQTDEITEISTPVIQVWDGILALPIIGTLDSARTQVVMENLLQAIVETESTIAILDISGVPAVDSLVAQHLMKTVSATRLMGAECIISGIRPEIAQTVVHLGIDLSQIITKSTLSSALQTSFRMLNLTVQARKEKKEGSTTTMI